LSHELRTPLNAIAGWVQILGQGALQGAQADRAIATVRRNVTMLRRLIEDLLDVSAIIAGKLALETSPCELAALVEQGVESAGADAATKDIRMKSELEPSVIVEADALRLRQVVGNLLSNAIKFTPAGGDITVTLHRADGHATLVVTDTGRGSRRMCSAHLRSVPPGGQQQHAPPWRPRAGTRDREVSGRAARRDGTRGERRARRRRALHDHLPIVS